MRDRAGLEPPLPRGGPGPGIWAAVCIGGRVTPPPAATGPGRPLVLAEASVLHLRKRACVCFSQARGLSGECRGAADPAPPSGPRVEELSGREEGAALLGLLLPCWWPQARHRAVSRGSLTEGWGRVCDLQPRERTQDSPSRGGRWGEAVRWEEAGPWQASMSGPAWPSLW